MFSAMKPTGQDLFRRVVRGWDRMAAWGRVNQPRACRVRAGRIIDAGTWPCCRPRQRSHPSEQTFIRGLGDDKPLLQWLKQVMWPLQAAMTPDDMRLASLSGLVENLRCGATSVNQHRREADWAGARQAPPWQQRRRWGCGLNWQAVGGRG